MSWERTRAFPLSKIAGIVTGLFTAGFCVAFLVRTYKTGEDVPGGVLGIIGALSGAFGICQGKSAVEAVKGVKEVRKAAKPWATHGRGEG